MFIIIIITIFAVVTFIIMIYDKEFKETTKPLDYFLKGGIDFTLFWYCAFYFLLLGSHKILKKKSIWKNTPGKMRWKLEFHSLSLFPIIT